MRRRGLVLAALSGLSLAAATRATDRAWPAKPIRLMVPFAPGGSSEIIARSVSAALAPLLGQPLLVEHKPGGSGNVAMQECLNAGDGHTIVLGHIGTLAVNPFLFARLPFDVNRDFAPVCLLAKVPSLYVVPANSPAKDLKQLVLLARQASAPWSYGSAGSGSAGHLGMEYLKLEAAIPLAHVPYRGTGPLMTDLLTGRLDAACVGAAAAMPFLRSGRLRCLATGSTNRLAHLPEVASVAEQGFPGFEMTQWYGLLAPAAQPGDQVAKLAIAAAQSLKAPATSARFAEEAVQAVGDDPARFRTFILAEQARWKKVVARAQIRLG